MVVAKQGSDRHIFFIMMKKKDFFEGRKSMRAAGSNNPRLIGEVINEFLHGQTPFARACRHRTGRARTGQAGAGSACSGCTWTENMRTGSAAAGRTWTGLYPNTELDVDLKLVTQEQGRMELGEYLDGMITRDGEDHFTFVENATEQSAATQASTRANGSTSSAEPTARSIRPSNGRRASGQENLATMPSIRPASC